MIPLRRRRYRRHRRRRRCIRRSVNWRRQRHLQIRQRPALRDCRLGRRLSVQEALRRRRHRHRRRSIQRLNSPRLKEFVVVPANVVAVIVEGGRGRDRCRPCRCRRRRHRSRP